MSQLIEYLELVHANTHNLRRIFTKIWYEQQTKANKEQYYFTKPIRKPRFRTTIDIYMDQNPEEFI